MATLDSVLTIKLSVEDRTRWDLLLGAIERLQATIEPTPEDPELVQHQIPESTGTVARCGAAFVDRGLAVNCAECKRLYRRWYDSKASRLEDQPDPHGAVPAPVFDPFGEATAHAPNCCLGHHSGACQTTVTAVLPDSP